MIIPRAGSIASSKANTIVIGWDMLSLPSEQDPQVRSVIKRWPHVKEEIDSYLYTTGALPGDLLTVKLDEDRTVVVIFYSGRFEVAWLQDALMLASDSVAVQKLSPKVFGYVSRNYPGLNAEIW